MRRVKRTILVAAGAGIVAFGVVLFSFYWSYFWGHDVAPAVGALAIIVVGLAVADCARARPFLRGGKKFWITLLATFIPIALVAISGMVAYEIESILPPRLFQAALGLFLTVLIVATVFRIKGQREISRAMLVADSLAIIFLLGGCPS